jgi:hypothetical protein
MREGVDVAKKMRTEQQIPAAALRVCVLDQNGKL